MGVLMILTLLATVGNTVMLAALSKKAFAHSAERRLDERVEAAARTEQRTYDRTEAEETRQSRAMEQGIENLMTYQVKLGRGRTSGGEV